jgi:hypothetical protein
MSMQILKKLKYSAYLASLKKGDIDKSVKINVTGLQSHELVDYFDHHLAPRFRSHDRAQKSSSSARRRHRDWF